MKDDLISRQALREEILRIAIATDDLYGMGVFEGLDRACKRINSAPSIKAAPVRHGRWLELHEENGHEMGICSRCHHERIIDNYCPNCGTKMDGGLTMDLIARETLIEILKTGGYWEIEDLEVAIACVEQTPPIDPVHAAGGCYCKECIYQTYDEEFDQRWCNRDLGCRAVRADGLGFCDQGMETQK